MSFGEQLRMLRQGHGLTQEEFAQQLQVSRQAVSKWESCRGYPEMEKIIYICNYYGIPIDELFAEEVPKADPQQPPPSQEAEPAIQSPTLRDAISNFFINLSPGNQTVFTAGLSLILMTLFIIVSVAATKGENNQMVMKLIWMGLLLLFGIGEALTVGLTSIWFAAGALLALICALMGGSMWLQIVLFFVASILSIAAFRPIAQKYFNSKVEPT